MGRESGLTESKHAGEILKIWLTTFPQKLTKKSRERKQTTCFLGLSLQQNKTFKTPLWAPWRTSFIIRTKEMNRKTRVDSRVVETHFYKGWEVRREDFGEKIFALAISNVTAVETLLRRNAAYGCRDDICFTRFCSIFKKRKRWK